MAITNQSVTELYVATFNRAPDAAGLNYWVNQSGLPSLEDIARSFFDQSETQAIYTPTMSVSDKVTLAYQNLFNRIPDSEGLAYWVQQLSTHAISQSNMLIALINGAHASTGSVNDAAILNNKTTVGLYFVDADLNEVETAGSIMEGITSDSATVTAARASIDAIVNNSITLDPSDDTGVSQTDHITNQYNNVMVSLKLTQAGSTVHFFDDLNGNDQQEVEEYVNSVEYSRNGTDYSAQLDFVRQDVSDGSPLPDGEHLIKAMQMMTDSNGVSSVISVSLPLRIILDTTLPTIEDFALLSSHGSATSEDNFATNRTTFTLTGTTEANAAVILYDEWDAQLLSTTADGNGHFSFEGVSVASQVHGHTYKFSARATDIAGSQDDRPIWVSVDTDQPGSLLMSYDNSLEQVDLMTYVQRSKMVIGQTTAEISGATSWYSTNSGATWTQAQTLTPYFDVSGQYTYGQIQIKQIDAAGNSTGITFNANDFSITSNQLSTTLLLGYAPPDSSNTNANTVTVNLGSDHLLNNGDSFIFYNDVSQILSLHQVGEVIEFNNPLLTSMGTTPSNGLVSDQHYYLVKGTYDENSETFTRDDNYAGTSVATLIVFDGDSTATVKQQGMVLVGISPLHMQQNTGEIALY